MSYGQLAYVYDFLMGELPYDQWLQFFEDKYGQSSRDGKRVLDLACGTGELSLRLAQKGYEVIGVDLSEDMLQVAMEKAERAGMDVRFFLQDMSELEGLGRFDAIVIFCDSINYLSNPEAVQNTFARVYEHLDEGGTFMFDVHSVMHMEEVFKDQTFTWNEPDIAYIWQSFAGEHFASVEHELAFFVLDEESGKYDRFDEVHKQRTYPIEQYKTWLLEVGFQISSIDADFEHEEPTPSSSRIFFTCTK